MYLSSSNQRPSSSQPSEGSGRAGRPWSVPEDVWEREEGGPKRITCTRTSSSCLSTVESKPLYLPENKNQGVTHVLTACMSVENALITPSGGTSSTISPFECELPGGSDSKASACNAGDPGSIPGSGRFPGEGNGNPLQYSCLENPMDRRACRLQSKGSQRVGHDCMTSLHYLHNNNHTDIRWRALCILHHLNLTTVLWGKFFCLLLFSTKSCLTFCSLMDYSPSGFSVYGILQAGILEWVAISYSRDWTWVSQVFCIGRQILYHCSTWEAMRQVLVFSPFPIKDPGAQRS